jgi:hypothetical protein
MKKVLLALFLFPLLLSAQVEYTVLEITDVVVKNQTDSVMGVPFNIYLKDDTKNRENILINSEKLNIKANFAIASNNNKRSSTKSGSVRVTVTYYSFFNEKKDKRKTEYIFYLNNERKFEVKETFVFGNGLKATQYTLTYKGLFKD